MKTNLKYLFNIEAPWISIGHSEPESYNWNPEFFYSSTGIKACVRRLRGNKMRTMQAFMDEFGAALQFLGEFGENWYALEECLQYLDEWLPADAYILVIEHAEEVLQDELVEQILAMLKTFNNVGKWWSQPINDNERFNRNAIPFHVLMNISLSNSSSVSKFRDIASSANIPVRFQS